MNKHTNSLKIKNHKQKKKMERKQKVKMSNLLKSKIK